MATILIVEDDPEVIRLLSQYFRDEGHEVLVAFDCASTLAMTSSMDLDLVLLDIVLGDEDGRDVLEEIKLISDVPIIFLTGRGLESDRIAGLKLGADDYIVKPFSLREVSARIESVLRRARTHVVAPSTESQVTRFGDLEINVGTHEVSIGGALLELTAKEFALLSYLASSPRQVFSREQLLEHVWSSSREWQNQATVTEHVRRLRSKIESDVNKPRWITTVRGVGYRFNP